MVTTMRMFALGLLLLGGCQGSLATSGITYEQAAVQLLSAPTAVCVSVISSQVQSLAALKQALANPTPALFP